MRLRRARPSDADGLGALIEASIRGFGPAHYDDVQIESSLKHLFGVDTRMIDDGTYFVVEEEGRVVGAGGWSRRRTPYGGDRARRVRDAALRDPASDPAVIRAFYVHPDCARRGIGRLLIEASEEAARAEGFTRCELVATLTGIPLYEAAGYLQRDPVRIELPDGVTLDAVRMTKDLPER